MKDKALLEMISDVLSNRKIAKENLGIDKVFTGKEAVELGFADYIIVEEEINEFVKQMVKVQS